jgi:hypothetical protein
MEALHDSRRSSRSAVHFPPHTDVGIAEPLDLGRYRPLWLAKITYISTAKDNAKCKDLQKDFSATKREDSRYQHRDNPVSNFHRA